MMSADATVQMAEAMSKMLQSCQALLFSRVNTMRRNAITLHLVRPMTRRVKGVEEKINCGKFERQCGHTLDEESKIFTFAGVSSDVDLRVSVLLPTPRWRAVKIRAHWTKLISW